MGEHSDKQYDGVHNPYDWTKGKTRIQPADSTASRPSTHIPAAIRISGQLNKWESAANGGYVRNFPGECIRKISAAPFDSSVPLAGLPLEQVKCSLDLTPFNHCQNLAEIQAANKREAETSTPAQIAGTTIRLKKTTLVVHLTDDQMKHVRDFYTNYSSPAKPGPARA